MYYNNRVVNGVLNIKQLQDSQGKFLDYDRFKESFKNIKTNFLEYISIVSAIKIYLKSNSYFKEKSKVTETITVQQTSSLQSVSLSQLINVVFVKMNQKI